jgi:hypothetical protein
VCYHTHLILRFWSKVREEGNDKFVFKAGLFKEKKANGMVVLLLGDSTIELPEKELDGVGVIISPT